MVMQLRTVQAQQQEYFLSLEKEVAERNKQVIRQKVDLEKNIIRLQKEIEHRQTVSEKLREQGYELQNSLDEKEVLLREIHHRIKNNMLIIISMLELQRQDIEGEKQRDIFKEMENRIRSMALVHEKLYSSDSISRIDIASYLRDVATSLLTSMVIGNRISFELQAEPISIDIDHAIPVGLVTNEIITNAIKHAFPQGRKGTISIDVRRSENNQIVLTLADDGIGIAEDVDILQSSSFGTGIIITALVKMQLKGKIAVEREKGTKHTISFLDPPVAQTIMNGRKNRILIVEDEILVGIMLSRKLQSYGYEVGDVIINGEEAVQIARTEQPDVVLMDIALSGNVNGLEAARKIRQDFDIPIIIFTGYDTEKLSQQTTDIDPVAIVSKLDDFEEILKAVEKAITG
jgi:two-component sensor histidine kinase